MDAPFQTSHAITCLQWSCLPVECPKQFLEDSTSFPVFCCSCPNLLETVFEIKVVFGIRGCIYFRAV